MADDLGCHPAVGACLGCEHPAQLRVVGGLDGDTKVCELDTARVVEEHVGALDLGVGVGVGARDSSTPKPKPNPNPDPKPKLNPSPSLSLRG